MPLNTIVQMCITSAAVAHRLRLTSFLAAAHLIRRGFVLERPTDGLRKKQAHTKMVGMYRQGGIPSPQGVLPTSHPLALRELEASPDPTSWYGGKCLIAITGLYPVMEGLNPLCSLSTTLRVCRSRSRKKQLRSTAPNPALARNLLSISATSFRARSYTRSTCGT